MLNKINFKIVSRILLIIILIACAVLIKNKLFTYAEFHQRIAVELSGSDSDVASGIQKLSANSNLSRIDKKNNIAYFENIAESDLQTKVLDDIKDIKNLKATIALEYYPLSESDLLLSNLLTFIVIAIASYICGFYFYLRTNNNFKLKHYLQLFAVFVFINAAAFIIQLGVMSAVSKYYEIRIIDLYSLSILSIISGLLVMLISTKLKNKSDVNFLNISTEFENITKQYFPLFFYAFAGILVVVSFGLGTVFVMTAVLIFVSMLITFFVYYVVSDLNVDIFMGQVSGQIARIRNSVRRKKNTESIKSSNTKKNKKSKKKRK